MALGCMYIGLAMSSIVNVEGEQEVTLNRLCDETKRFLRTPQALSATSQAYVREQD